MPIRWRIFGILGVTILLCTIAVPASANNQVWRGTGGVTAFSLTDSRLEATDLSVERIGAAAEPGAPNAFRVRNGADLFFRVQDGRFVGFLEPAAVLTHDGGFALRSPALSTVLTGFAVEIEPSPGRLLARIRGAHDAPAPLEVRNAGFWFDAEHGQLTVRGADLVVSAEWADRIGRPDLAEWWIGALDLRLDAKLVREEASDSVPSSPEGVPPVLDVLLHEVYGLTTVGRLGTYPTGTLGLSFATTGCNNGNVNVPWHAPMAEDHPFMTLAMFRETGGRMEMIGKSWTKHAFYALANDQCNLGCVGGGGGYLAIGCSDTYSVANNSSQFYLGPPEEVNPHTGVWRCLGSWFDGVPVDCVRSQDGSGLNPVEHRLEVWEDQLVTPGSNFYYEGVYYVMDDAYPLNNFMWQKCAANWNGTTWSFPDLGTPGGYLEPLMLTWGDQQDHVQVAADDGFVILSTTVTDNGNGTWHYEYALYNQSSDRAVEAFTVPVGGATLTNVGFHDIDRDPGTDWSFATAAGQATWDTPSIGDPAPSYPLTYQTMFNFRFDANAAPQPASATARLHKTGIGSVAFLDTQSPTGGAVDVSLPVSPEADFALFPNEPNPFRESTRISFALGAKQSARLVVTDVTGRTVRTLLDGVAPAGETSLRWNGRDDNGRQVASGIYFFRLETAERSRTIKGNLLR